jgi:hypothetical protein
LLLLLLPLAVLLLLLAVLLLLLLPPVLLLMLLLLSGARAWLCWGHVVLARLLWCMPLLLSLGTGFWRSTLPWNALLGRCVAAAAAVPAAAALQSHVVLLANASHRFFPARKEAADWMRCLLNCLMSFVMLQGDVGSSCFETETLLLGGLCCDVLTVAAPYISIL